ncbi:MAG: hypothetical protein VX871_02720 [Pseudomonadota bacterium]|nr:hypothetical protein [Pseudomonadota bacterium]
MRLNLSRPKETTFIISAVLAGLTLLGQVVALPIFSAYGFGLLLIAWIVLAAGVLMDNM